MRQGSRVRLCAIAGQPTVYVPLAKMGLRLSVDGEVALLGFVHHHLAQWAARAAAGEVAPPAGGFTYGWDGSSTLEIPVLEADAKAVSAVVRAVLACPGATEPMVPAPGQFQERAS